MSPTVHEIPICPTCNGTGEIIDKDGYVKTCPQCGGSGIIPGSNDDE